MSVDPSKLEAIKAGKKIKSETGASENKKVTVTKSGDKIIAVEKEKKFEEAGVTPKKRNFVMYESKTGTEKETDLQKIKGQRLKAPRPRVEETIIMKRKKKEYLDNYQYHETKDIKNPRSQSIVVHQRLGDIIGGTFEETTMERKVFAQGSNRPQLAEKTTTVKASGSASPAFLMGNKSAIVLKKTTVTTGAAPKPTGNAITVNKKTTTTTTNTNTRTRANPTNATAKKEKVTETTTRRRNEGTGSKTETKTETKTTTSGTRGAPTGSTSTTTKTTTRTTTQKPAAETTEKSSTTTTTKTTTTRTTKTTKTTEGDGGY